jgi:8-oxo-dGTP diphosphatase
MIVNVEAAIVRNGRFLMIVRAAHEAHAAGALSMPGGKVDAAGMQDDVLEETARREVREEVGLELGATLHYVESHAFMLNDGTPVVDIVLLCRADSGEPHIAGDDEVAALQWMTAADVARHPLAPPWTVRSVLLAEQKRLACGW